MEGEKLQAAALVLAGGDSKRFGYPKAFLNFNGKLIIDHIIESLSRCFADIIVVTHLPERLQHLEVKTTKDLIDIPSKSSLRGLHAGLSVSDFTYNFVIACDMPFVNLDFIKYMYFAKDGHDVVVPEIDGYLQPLYAFYKRNCVDIIEENLYSGRFKITEFFKKVKVRYIDTEEINRFDPEQKMFFNINTSEDYQQAQQILNEYSPRTKKSE